MDHPYGRRFTGSGHLVGATYHCSYWNDDYQVVDRHGEYGVKVKLTRKSPSQGSGGRQVGEEWTHSTRVDRRDQVTGTPDLAEIQNFGTLGDGDGLDALTAALTRILAGWEAARVAREVTGKRARGVVTDAEFRNAKHGVSMDIADVIQELTRLIGVGVDLDELSDQVSEIGWYDAFRQAYTSATKVPPQG